MSDAPNSPTDKDTELTMCDVLEEEQELEEDANAVLGGSDDKNCSYDQGYVSRQALYACLKCSGNDEAGICLACCYACHDGHEVVELYTKRNFRCDCGNSKFNDKNCTLRPSKEPFNSKNKYNQNFKGLYCRCSRPYPDLEDSIPDEMIQCIFCEDWYHGRHLGVKVPEDYYEMICDKCMESHSFLYTYLNLYEMKVDVVGNQSPKSLASYSKFKSDNSDNDSEQTNETAKVEQGNGEPIVKVEQGNGEPIVKVEQGNGESIVKVEQGNDGKVKVDSTKLGNIEHSNGINSNENEESVIKDELKNVCLLMKLKTSEERTTGAAFWPENWRKELCRCSTCMEMYCQFDCEFLLDPDDTIQAYEVRGKKENSESQYDQGLSALSQMDRVKQMEAIHAYTSMKGELKEYLSEFAKSKRTVRESDIREFFEQMQKKKKLNNGVPHFCR